MRSGKRREVQHELPKILYSSRRERSSVFVEWSSSFATSSVVCSAIFRWPGQIKWPNQAMILAKNRYFIGLMEIPTSYGSSNTRLVYSMWSQGDFEDSTMSAEYTCSNCQRTEASMTCVALWNVARALVQAERQFSKLVQAVSRCKCRLFVILSVNVYLPVPRLVV